MRTLVWLLALLLLGGAPGLLAQDSAAPGQPRPHPYRLRFEPSGGERIAREDVRRIVERAIENRFRQPVEVAEGAEAPAYMDVRVMRPPQGGYGVEVACVGVADAREEPVRGTATGTEPVSVLGLGAMLAAMVSDETLACRIPAGAAARADPGPGDGLAEALRVADPELVAASSTPGRLELRYRDGVVVRIPTDSVTLAADARTRRLELVCHASLCIRPTGQPFADAVVWSFPMESPGDDAVRRAYRRAASALAALVPLRVFTDTTAAPPAPDVPGSSTDRLPLLPEM